MKVTYTEFAEIAREYYDLKLKSSAYLQNVPNDIASFIYDNEYLTNAQAQGDMLMKQLFGNDLFECFMWFLYDTPMDKKQSNATGADGHEYFIVDMNSFLSYVYVEYFGETF